MLLTLSKQYIPNIAPEKEHLLNLNYLCNELLLINRLFFRSCPVFQRL